jgi:hypothetical protein
VQAFAAQTAARSTVNRGMLRAMRGTAIFFALATGLYGCGPDCTPSADIQVTLVPSPAVDPSLVATVRLGLSVDGGPTRVLDFTPSHPLDAPSSFILHPDSPPATNYTVAITVEVFDAAGALLEVGGASGDVVPSGCNRLNAGLAALPGAGDGAVPDAGPGFDLIPPPADLTCTGPDEDGDGRPNSCDLCPADYDPQPTDADVDGLPDACDPDVNRATNRLLYFEPFDVTDGHWSGSFQVTGSELVMQTQGTAISSNGLDVMPADVRAQSFMTAAGVFGQPQTTVADIGLFLGSNADLRSAATGMLCTINHNPSGDTLDLNTVQNGQLQFPPIGSQPYAFGTGIIYRMRLLQHGVNYSCEAVTNGFPTTTVTATVAQAPSAPQYLALHGTNVEVHFQSVVAETVLP